MIKLRHKKKRQEATVEITPLIDIVFILLVFFMLTAVIAPQGISLSLPEAATTSPQESPEILLSLDATGNIYWKEEMISLESLKTKLQAYDPKTPIVLKADRQVDYGSFVELIDTLRQVANFPLSLSATKEKNNN
ncbi:MAG: biopolymer transporter ExbD [Deltaproteobacteria bacterium]|nr:biopolymer transporter ExbD [Deltaproteobacteria bacterium]